MKIRFGLLALLCVIIVGANTQHISNYKVFTGIVINGRDRESPIVLRKFYNNGIIYYLTVSPKTLSTSVINADSVIIRPASWDTLMVHFSATPYIHALQQAKVYSSPLQNAGFRKLLTDQKGIDLTIDLCPSHLPLDRVVFTDLIHEMEHVEKPVPVAISITGRWMNAHPDDLDWLTGLVKKGDLSITWINHTYNHYTSKDLPLKMNFLLEPGTDINAEILNTEIAMLERGLMPSVFFRFPGLVSDVEIYQKILNFGLIPVGSDAWLAKGQQPGDGSIVLIHANGNEPIGIKDFILLLKKEGPDILDRQWELYDLRESVVEDVNQQ